MASWSTFIFKSVRSLRFIYWKQKGCNELIKSDSKDVYAVKNILQINVEISLFPEKKIYIVFNIVIMKVMIMRNVSWTPNYILIENRYFEL